MWAPGRWCAACCAKACAAKGGPSRCRLFEHLQRLPATEQTKTSGDLIYRVTWDTYCIHTIIDKGLVPALMALVTLASVTAIMLREDVLATIGALSVGLPVMIYIRR